MVPILQILDGTNDAPTVLRTTEQVGPPFANTHDAVQPGEDAGALERVDGFVDGRSGARRALRNDQPPLSGPDGMLV
jgi:hypothetical protein